MTAATPDETPAPRAHLTTRSGDASRYGTEGAREWYCTDCCSRITVSPDGQREYGHESGCDHHATYSPEGTA